VAAVRRTLDERMEKSRYPAGTAKAVSEARVMCGDCLTVMRDFAPGSFDT